MNNTDKKRSLTPPCKEPARVTDTGTAGEIPASDVAVTLARQQPSHTSQRVATSQSSTPAPLTKKRALTPPQKAEIQEHDLPDPRASKTPRPNPHLAKKKWVKKATAQHKAVRGTRASKNSSMLTRELADVTARERGARDAAKEMKDTRETNDDRDPRLEACVQYRRTLLAKWPCRTFYSASLRVLHGGAIIAPLEDLPQEAVRDLEVLQHMRQGGESPGGTFDAHGGSADISSDPAAPYLNPNRTRYSTFAKTKYLWEEGRGMPVISIGTAVTAVVVAAWVTRQRRSQARKTLAMLASLVTGYAAGNFITSLWGRFQPFWRLLSSYAATANPVPLAASPLRTLNNVAAKLDIEPARRDALPWFMSPLWLVDRIFQQELIYSGHQPGVKTALVYVAYSTRHPATFTDARPSAARSSLRVDDMVLLQVTDIYRPFDRSFTRLLVCPEILDQSVASLTRMGKDSSRYSHSKTLTARLNSFNIDATIDEPIKFGTSIMAELLTRTRDIVAHHTVAKTETFGGPLRDLGLMILLSAVAGHLVRRWLPRPNTHLHTATLELPVFGEEGLLKHVMGETLEKAPLHTSQGPTALYYYIILVAPWLEEANKSLMSTLPGVKKPHYAACFGVFEYFMKGNSAMWVGLPAIILHLCTGFLPFGTAVAAHMTFNIVAMALPHDTASTTFAAGAAALAVGGLLHLFGDRASDDMLSEAMLAYQPKTVGVGYRVSDVDLGDPGEHGAVVTTLPGFDDNIPRKPLQRAIGPTVFGLAPVMPDAYHPPTMLHGCKKRFCRNPPPFERRMLQRLKKFSRQYARDHYVPIPVEADLSVETWLARTTYPLWRQQQLLEAHKESGGAIGVKERYVDGFIKMESYLEYKAARGINSRSDAFKCFSGPVFKLIEDQVYADKSFIKHVPVHLRPKYIVDYFDGKNGYLYETDYSQFEKHFIPPVMEALEMQLYRHMLQNHPGILDVIIKTMKGINTCRYKKFIIKVQGRRMSGEMCTSLGNGFSNLMLALFMASENGGTASALVEGDDALIVSTVPLDGEEFKRLGFDIKMEQQTSLFLSSFCQLRMASDFTTLADPRKILLKFGWSHSPLVHSSARVRMELLRAKALSLAYEYPQCPVVWALAKRALELTQGHKARFEAGVWESGKREWVEQFSELTMAKLQSGPSAQARFEFSQMFGISLECQFELEQVIQSADLGEMRHPAILALYDGGYRDCAEYYDKFCMSDDRDLEF